MSVSDILCALRFAVKTSLMHPMLTIATRAARAAGDIIIRNIDKLDRITI